MVFDFEKTMKDAPDEELIRIVFTNRHEYQEAAIVVAETELSTRNLSEEFIAGLIDKQTNVNSENAYKANIPLEVHWKIIAFLFPGIFQLLIAGSFKATGYHRKANEVGKWTFLGLFFYLALAIYSAL